MKVVVFTSSFHHYRLLLVGDLGLTRETYNHVQSRRRDIFFTCSTTLAFEVGAGLTLFKS